MRQMPCLQEAGEGVEMRVMCQHHSKKWLSLCRRFPDNTGWLIGPTWSTLPPIGVEFAMDNDAFQTFTSGKEYDFIKWLSFLGDVKSTGRTPLWALVPDVVGNRDKTLEQWDMFNQEVSVTYGWKSALAVQDGMTRDDVLGLNFQPDVIFVGGTTEWKWGTAHLWCRDFPRVHVGRVRSRRLPYCQQIGAESCDGTGWFRESVNGRPARQLEAWLEHQEPHPELNLQL